MTPAAPKAAPHPLMGPPAARSTADRRAARLPASKHPAHSAGRAMLQIDLREYEPSEQTPTAAQRDALLGDAKELKLSIKPIVGTSSRYLVTPGSTVGAVEISDMSVRIEPKIGIPQLLSLACYSMRLFKPQQDKPFDFREDEALPDVLALALIS